MLAMWRISNDYIFSLMNLSPIQNQIISRLKNADILRYRDMHPAEVPNDLYNYHLKALISKKLVDKTDAGYCLSKKGRQYVADVHHTSDQANRLFKINVITIVTRIFGNKLQVLVQKRMSQPSYGIIGVMGGTIVKGESMIDGAKRKLEQETGLFADFRVIGFERRQLYKSNELFSDVLFPICYATNASGVLIETSEFGENSWMNVNDAIELNQRPFDSIQAITKVLEFVRDNTIDSQVMFYDEIIQSDT
jgi:8-oxo-dGTP pyrophosphatase MutT (NUDIX family)